MITDAPGVGEGWVGGKAAGILSARAEQVALFIDFHQAAREGRVFEGLSLPSDLHAATAVRRVQYLAGRYCAMEALARLEPGRPSVAVGRGDRGIPVWPSGVVGSITHTEGFVSAAVATTDRTHALGIDSERIVTSQQAQAIATQVSWPSELAHACTAGLDRLEAMTLVFSAKESIFKCLFPLIRTMFYYHDARIVGVDGCTRTFRARLVKTLSPDFPADTIVEGRFDVSDSRVHTGVCLDAV